jgi:hypothetical protein
VSAMKLKRKEFLLETVTPSWVKRQL